VFFDMRTPVVGLRPGIAGRWKGRGVAAFML
jgi:hypothetical protein